MSILSELLESGFVKRLARGVPEALEHTPIRIIGEPSERLTTNIVEHTAHLLEKHPTTRLEGINIVGWARPSAANFNDASRDTSRWLEHEIIDASSGEASAEKIAEHIKWGTGTNYQAWAWPQTREMTFNEYAMTAGAAPYEGKNLNHSVANRAATPKEYANRIGTHEFGHLTHYSTSDRMLTRQSGSAHLLRPNRHQAEVATDLYLNSNPTLLRQLGSEYGGTNVREGFAEMFSSLHHEREYFPQGSHGARSMDRMERLLGMNTPVLDVNNLEDVYGNYLQALAGEGQEIRDVSHLVRAEPGFIIEGGEGAYYGYKGPLPASSSSPAPSSRLSRPRRPSSGRMAVGDRSGAFLNSGTSSARQGLPRRSSGL